MPALENQRHEAFCRNIVKGMTIDEAYKKAGFKANRGNAARLNADERVKRRISEMRRSLHLKIEITLETQTAKLERAYEVAEEAKQSAAMTHAAMAQAKLHGLLVDRVEVENTHRFANLADGELAFELSALLAKARGLRDAKTIEGKAEQTALPSPEKAG